MQCLFQPYLWQQFLYLIPWDWITVFFPNCVSKYGVRLACFRQDCFVHTLLMVAHLDNAFNADNIRTSRQYKNNFHGKIRHQHISICNGTMIYHYETLLKCLGVQDLLMLCGMNYTHWVVPLYMLLLNLYKGTCSCFTSIACVVSMQYHQKVGTKLFSSKESKTKTVFANHWKS